jgi:hypothetical protein
MEKKLFSGLDELMIVNPDLHKEQQSLPFGQVFIGDDGTLYRLEGLEETGSFEDHAEFYLGEDGTLYQVIRT